MTAADSALGAYSFASARRTERSPELSCRVADSDMPADYRAGAASGRNLLEALQKNEQHRQVRRRDARDPPGLADRRGADRLELLAGLAGQAVEVRIPQRGRDRRRLDGSQARHHLLLALEIAG